MKDRNGIELRLNDVCLVHNNKPVRRYDKVKTDVGDIVEFHLVSCDMVSAYCHFDSDGLSCHLNPQGLEIIGDVR